MTISCFDQIQRSIQITFPAKRIVSLVPSQTELLHGLGLEDEVVGITKFCVHPAHWFKTKKRVGGTKKVDIETVRKLQPDLIIANKEENTREQIEALEKIAPVWVSNIETVDDAEEMIRSVGNMVAKSKEAEKMISDIEAGFRQFTVASNIRTAYLIWLDPLMAAGKGTFVDDLMGRIGFENIFADLPRYPVVTVAQLENKGCDLLLLSSEPFPFNEKHIHLLQPLLPTVRMELVDGEMFSWYGSRLLLAQAYLLELGKKLGTVRLAQHPQQPFNNDHDRIIHPQKH